MSITIDTLLFVGALAVSAGALASLVTVYRIERDHQLDSIHDFLLHSAWGLAFLGFVHLPAIVLALPGKTIYPSTVNIIYSIAVGMSIGAHFLFLRGIFLARGKNMFWRTIFPVLLIVPQMITQLVLFSLLGNDAVPVATTFFMFGFVIPLEIYFGWFFWSVFWGNTRHIAVIFTFLGWFILALLNLYIWFEIIRFPSDFWVIKLVSVKYWYVFNAFVELMLIGAFWNCRKLLFTNLSRAIRAAHQP